MLGKQHRTEEDWCPNCGIELDGCSGVATNEGPIEGDFSICGYCGAGLRFGKNLKLRLLTEEDNEDMPPHYTKLLELTQQFIKENKSAKAKGTSTNLCH